MGFIKRRTAKEKLKTTVQDVVEKLWEWEGCQGYCDTVGSIANCLDAIPDADAVEVVRCKDCKYLGEMYTKTRDGEEWHFCTEQIPSGVELNDFCSFGERRAG